MGRSKQFVYPRPPSPASPRKVKGRKKESPTPWDLIPVIKYLIHPTPSSHRTFSFSLKVFFVFARHWFTYTLPLHPRIQIKGTGKKSSSKKKGKNYRISFGHGIDDDCDGYCGHGECYGAFHVGDEYGWRVQDFDVVELEYGWSVYAFLFCPFLILFP